MNGDELRALREAAGVGLRELARAIGRDRGEVTDYGWLALDRIEPEALRNKLRKRLS